MKKIVLLFISLSYLLSASDYRPNDYSHNPIIINEFNSLQLSPSDTDTIVAGNFLLLIDKNDELIYDYFFNEDLSEARRNVLVKLFEDLTELIEFKSDLPVKYKLSAVYDGAGYTASARQVFYRNSNETSSITEGAVWLAINTGEEPYKYLYTDMNTLSKPVKTVRMVELKPFKVKYEHEIKYIYQDLPYYGEIIINTKTDFNYNYEATKFDNTDFYSVILHEVIHSLGFGTLINNKDFDSEIKFNRFFSRYDTFIHILNNTKEFKLIDSFINPKVNDNVSLSDINNECTTNSTSVYFKGSNNDNIFLAASSEWRKGVSLNHIDTCKENGEGHIMYPYLKKGTYQRFPSQTEYNILCELGYKLTDVYGKSSESSAYKQYISNDFNIPVARNDLIEIEENDYTAIAIPYSDIISNDINVERIEDITLTNYKLNLFLDKHSLANEFDTLHIKGDFNLYGKIIIRYTGINNEGLFSNPGYIVINIKDTNLFCDTQYNLICNSGIEQTWNYAGFDYPFCTNNHTLNWAGFSSDIFARWANPNIFLFSFKIPYYQKYTYDADIDNYYVQNPDTWDNDPYNQHYLHYATYTSKSKSSNHKTGYAVKTYSEFFFQPFIQKPKPNTKYILDLRCFMSYEYWNIIKTPNHREWVHEPDLKKDSGSIFIFLSEDMICKRSGKNYMWKDVLDSSRIFSPDFPDYEMIDEIEERDFIVANRKIPVDLQWRHFKSEPFYVPDEYNYINFASNLNHIYNHDSLFWHSEFHEKYYPERVYIMGMLYFYDDIYMREAFASINMVVDNYKPCIGDTVNFSIEIWKDVPEDIINFELLGILPYGLEYIEGDFEKTGDGKLKYEVKNNHFNNEDKINLYFSAFISKEIKSKNILTKLFIEGKSDEFVKSLGKTELVLSPDDRLIEIEKSYKKPICRDKPIEIFYKISNFSKIPQMLEISLFEDKRFEIIDTTIKLNGRYLVKKNRDISSGERFIRRLNNLNDSLLLLSYNYNSIYIWNLPVFDNPYGTDDSTSAIISYEVFTDSQDSIFISELYFKSDNSCSYKQFDTLYIHHQKPEYAVNDFYLICDTLNIEMPNADLKYEWSDVSIGNNAQFTEPGEYWVTITDSFNCSYTETFKLEKSPKQKIYCLQDTILGKVSNREYFNVYFEEEEFNKNTEGRLRIHIPKKYLALNESMPVIEENDSMKIHEKSVIYDFEKDDYLLKALSLQVNALSPRTEKLIIEYFSDECKRHSADTIYFRFSSPIENSRIIDSFSQDFAIESYPNPNSGELNIKMQVAYGSEIKLMLYDLTGKEMILYSGHLQKGAYEARFDISKLSSGFYSLEMLIDNRYKRYDKILLQK